MWSLNMRYDIDSCDQDDEDQDDGAQWTGCEGEGQVEASKQRTMRW
jgi:hypothetical protein